MKGLHRFLKIFIFVQLGACFGRVLAKYLDYVKHPGLYAMQSAPWYVGIIVTVVLTAIMVTVTTVAYFIVGYLIRKREQRETENGKGCIGKIQHGE